MLQADSLTAPQAAEPAAWQAQADTLQADTIVPPTLRPWQPDSAEADSAVLGVGHYIPRSYFGYDSLPHPGYGDTPYGVAGELVPKAIGADNVVTAALLACFIIGMAAVSGSRRFVAHQAKNLFRPMREAATGDTETSAEVRLQLILALQTCVVAAIAYYSCTLGSDPAWFSTRPPSFFVGVFAAVFVAYAAAKAAAYTVANTVFFGRRRNLLWLKFALFVAAAAGVLLFPVVLLRVYFDLSVAGVAWSVAVILAAAKMLTLYKCFVIFFRRKGGFVQIILYFCTLEIAPLATLWGLLVATGNLLKQNF